LKRYKDYNYFITKSGLVWSGFTNKWLSPFSNRDGYAEISLSKEGKQQTRLVHRLVLEAFVGPCPNGKVCRHLDGNPANNNLSNICWDTQSNNLKDKAKHNTVPWGETSPNHRLEKEEVQAIRYLYLKCGLTQKDIADRYDITQSHVSRLVNKNCWSRLSLGEF